MCHDTLAPAFALIHIFSSGRFLRVALTPDAFAADFSRVFSLRYDDYFYRQFSHTYSAVYYAASFHILLYYIILILMPSHF